MIRDVNDALQLLNERTLANRRDRRQDQLQRRNQVVDMYGVEFNRQGDSTHPATFDISVSPDIIYYERFEFKLIVRPFAMPIAGNGATGSTTVSVNGTSLSASTTGSGSVTLPDPVNPGTYPVSVSASTTVSPNPHTHTTNPHNHSLDAGVSLFTSSVSNVRVVIEGIDVTQSLKDQYGGAWIDGEGTYPNRSTDNYDLITVAGDLYPWQRGVLLAPGFKTVQVFADGVFNVSFIEYLKYNHMNR